MNYLIYDKDGDEPGRITQSNKVYQPEGYDGQLQELGHEFVAIENPGYLNPDRFLIADGEPMARSEMPITVSKRQIKAGGSDKAVFRGVPIGAKASVSTGGMLIGSDVIPSGEFDLPIPVPCIYRVTITLWPFLDFVADIEATP